LNHGSFHLSNALRSFCIASNPVTSRESRDPASVIGPPELFSVREIGHGGLTIHPPGRVNSFTACALPRQQTGRGDASHNPTKSKARSTVAHDRPDGDCMVADNRLIAGDCWLRDMGCILVMNL
jgi:hypothetical protein